MRTVAILGAVLMIPMSVGSALSAQPAAENGCVVDGFFDGSVGATSPSEALDKFAGNMTKGLVSTQDAAEAERARLLAAAVVGLEPVAVSEVETIYRSTDPSGNLIAEFDVRKSGEGWSIDSFSVSLPAELCAALAKR